MKPTIMDYMITKDHIAMHASQACAGLFGFLKLLSFCAVCVCLKLHLCDVEPVYMLSKFAAF